MIEYRPASQLARDTVGMHVSGLRGSLEPTMDRKRERHRKFADYYSRSFGFARINNLEQYFSTLLVSTVLSAT